MVITAIRMATLRLALGAVVVCLLLPACFVYDDTSLKRVVPRTSERPDVGVEIAEPRDVLDSGLSHSSKEPPAGDAAPPEHAVATQRVVDAGTRANPALSETKKKSMSTDSGVRMPVDAASSAHDSGERTPVGSGATDASAESGYCAACDNTTPSPPVLNDSGGTGNVTALGNVMSPTPSAGGACNYGNTSIRYFAAINANASASEAQSGQWQGGKICGQCAAVRVKTEQGWKETVVRIMDKCNDPNCGIALGGAPAKDLMGDRPGRYQGGWRFVSCAEHPAVSDAAPALRIKEGSSRYWALVHVENPTQAVTAIDSQSLDGAGSGSFAYATEAENYFSVPEAVHTFGMIRLTLQYRDKTTATLELAPSQLATPDAAIMLP